MRKAIAILQEVTERAAELLSSTVPRYPSKRQRDTLKDHAKEAQLLKDKIKDAEAKSSTTSVYEDALEYIALHEAVDLNCQANRLLGGINFVPTLDGKRWKARNSYVEREVSISKAENRQQSARADGCHFDSTEGDSGSHTLELCYT